MTFYQRRPHPLKKNGKLAAPLFHTKFDPLKGGISKNAIKCSLNKMELME
jgi:hypothetical protein